MNNLIHYNPSVPIEYGKAYLNMPDSVYRSFKAFNYSGLKEFKKSPAHYKAYLEKEHVVDPDLEIYKAVHLMTLEDPSAQNRIVIKDGRWAGALKEEVQSLQSEGYIVLKQDGYDEAKNISASIKSHPLAADLLGASLGEVSIFWLDKHTNCPLKARVDILTLKDGEIYLGDLKNFTGLHDEEFIGQQVVRQNYMMQMALYAQGIEAVLGKYPKFIYWVFIEPVKPYGCKIRRAGMDHVFNASKAFIEHFRRYLECSESNTWPCYDIEDAPLLLPAYFLSKQGVSNE